MGKNCLEDTENITHAWVRARCALGSERLLSISLSRVSNRKFVVDVMGKTPAPGCLLLQLLQKDDDETLRELCRRDSVAGMVQALDAQGGNRGCAGASSAAWTANARLVLDTLATVGVAVDDHHATPPLDEYALETDEADRRHSARLRLTTVVKRRLGYERYLHRPRGVHGFGHAAAGWRSCVAPAGSLPLPVSDRNWYIVRASIARFAPAEQFYGQQHTASRQP